MFDNSLPTSYSQIRQLVRRSAHNNFLSHYSDYVTQVRAELASRRVTAGAFGAQVSHLPRQPDAPDPRRGRDPVVGGDGALASKPS